LELDPVKRLCRTAEIILDYDLVRYDIGIRQWALSNEKVAEVVASVNQKRMDFVGGALQELGFTGEDLEMRTRYRTRKHTGLCGIGLLIVSQISTA